MKIYAISDTHFNHTMLVERGFRPADFVEQICANLERASGDLLIHCGDFAIGGDEVAMEAFMNSTKRFKKKILVRGNHDSHSDSWWVERGFDFVCERFENKYFGKNIAFSHIPVPFEDGLDFNVHGHMHGNTHRLKGELAKFYDPSYHRDLAPELHHYAPVNLETFL